ncbi:NUDIX hydrolase [Cytobacillus gottheilii]|uniref:NUDIX hydrolase n=1 Tax=Cytobacillus gottheilii TaxID=859144 RepID=UPI0009B9EDCA|nr:NUDIX hydrolase [Cytobacillus gottheilii]
MKKGQIRAISICVFRTAHSILVAEGFDEFKGENYYRPIGGGIEYGETSAEAVIREVNEEIGAEITNIQFLGTLENIFRYNGELGHEIVFVYEAEFTDPSFYKKSSFMGVEDNGAPFKLVWKPISDFAQHSTLVPGQLYELLGY